jgi:hypothetical protein
MVCYTMHLESSQVYDMTDKLVCVYTHPVVTYVTDGDWCITWAMCDIQFQ